VASPRDIRRRIRSISNTAQITRAMQMVAASKMRKAQQAAIEVRPFVQLLYRIQRKATTRRLDFRHPLLEVRPVRKRAIILVASDKGLCGALNSNLFRLVGRLVADFPYGDTPRFPESRAIAALARDLFLKGEVDEVQVVVTRFVNTLVQQPVVLQFLPVGDIRGVEVPGAPPPEALAADRTEFLFEPNADDIIGYLLGHYLNIFIHLVLLNAKASEQSARMVSMKGATDNAVEMIKHLTLEYNKLRQGRITQELLEIAGGQAQ